jgi:hypothetical protein
MPSKPRRQCTAHVKGTRKRCGNSAIRGGTVCTAHGGKAPRVAARAAVLAELETWGLGDSNVDPGEMLLRLVTQSGRRVDFLSGLLAEAYAAAERLKVAHEAEELIETAEGVEETAATQVARDDLRRIFNTGGISALIGNTYGDSKTGGIYATGEAIRGLADLEAKERDRCAGMAAKAVAAGLAKRQVELAERQGALIAQLLTAVFDELDLTDAQREAAPDVLDRHLRLVAS